MNILIFHNSVLPVSKYGGTERIVYWLGKQYALMGHRVTFLCQAGSTSDFARMIVYNPDQAINDQIPEDIDVVHLDHKPLQPLTKPYIVMIQGNEDYGVALDLNTIFVSKNHANRYNSEAYVHNGLDLTDYGKPTFTQKRTHLHFLAKASWRLKNVQGAIELARKTNHKLAVLGGTRLNIKMGFRFTPYPSIKFYGMVGGEEKNAVLNNSKGLLFPVLWHEPFGIALIESLYMGCPVFGTPYGSLPELITSEVGFLSNKKSELITQLTDIEQFDNKKCSEYVADNFTIKHTAEAYLKYYEVVLNGKTINQTPPSELAIQPKFLAFD
jgi:glycosyltransferase involved in cell wall biosynthesis